MNGMHWMQHEAARLYKILLLGMSCTYHRGRCSWRACSLMTLDWSLYDVMASWNDWQLYTAVRLSGQLCFSQRILIFVRCYQVNSVRGWWRVWDEHLDRPVHIGQHRLGTQYLEELLHNGGFLM